MDYIRPDITYTNILLSDFRRSKKLAIKRITDDDLPYWRKWIDTNIFCTRTDVSKRSHYLYMLAELALGEDGVDEETLKVIDRLCGKTYIVDLVHMVKIVCKWIWHKLDSTVVVLDDGVMVPLIDLRRYLEGDGDIGKLSEQMFYNMPDSLHYSTRKDITTDTRQLLTWLRYKILINK